MGLSAPLIYGRIIPFVLIDLFISVYQAFSFPLYGIPKVRRSDFIVFDRGKLCYLNLLERINCAYCSYGNGVMACGRSSGAHGTALVARYATRTQSSIRTTAIRIFSRRETPLPTAQKPEDVRTDFKDVQP